jgi:hypothetical protein
VQDEPRVSAKTANAVDGRFEVSPAEWQGRLSFHGPHEYESLRSVANGFCASGRKAVDKRREEFQTQAGLQCGSTQELADQGIQTEEGFGKV